MSEMRYWKYSLSDIIPEGYRLIETKHGLNHPRFIFRKGWFDDGAIIDPDFPWNRINIYHKNLYNICKKWAEKQDDKIDLIKHW